MLARNILCNASGMSKAFSFFSCKMLYNGISPNSDLIGWVVGRARTAALIGGVNGAGQSCLLRQYVAFSGASPIYEIALLRPLGVLAVSYIACRRDIFQGECADDLHHSFTNT